MMKNIIILLSITFNIKAFSQVQFNSIQDVLNFADSHSTTILTSKLQQKADESKAKQAKSFFYPSVNGVAGFNDNITLQPTLVPAKIFNPGASEDTFEEMYFGKQYNYNTGIQVQWDILNFQKNFAYKTSNLLANSSKINIEKNKFILYNQLASSYYSILLTQKSIEIFAENVKQTESLLKSAKEKYEKGIISELELNEVAIKHLGNKKNLDAAINNLGQYEKQLQSQLNTQETINVAGNLEADNLTNTAIESTNPEVLYQENQVKVSESVLKQNKALYYPSLSIFYQNSYNWATHNFFDFNNANRLPSQVLSIKMNIPIFNGFYNHEKTNEAKTQLKIQEMQLESLKLSKQKEDEILILQYNEAKQNLEKNKSIYTLQQKNDQHTENKYNSGIISLDDRLSKYTDLLSVQYQYLQSLADFSLSQYKILIRQIDYQQNISK